MIIYHDSGRKPLFRECFTASGADFTPLYKNYLLLHIRRMTGIQGPKRWLFNVPGPAVDDDKIIVFDTHVTPSYLYWLCQQYPKKRILLWYWNPVDKRRNFELFPRCVEIWSYSPQDCEAYGFRYNSQFYFDCIADSVIPAVTELRPHPQVLFLGREKGRKKELLQIREMLGHSGAEPNFHFMQDGTKANRHAESTMPYTQVTDLIRSCDVLLDYSMKETAGLSLRPMEALFFGKKLITNQKMIRQYRFYQKENFYILGEEERSLREFLEEPYIMPEPEIRDYYRLSNWMKRFDQPEDDRL